MHQGLRLGSVVSLAALALLVVRPARERRPSPHWRRRQRTGGRPKETPRTRYAASAPIRKAGGGRVRSRRFGPDQAFSFARAGGKGLCSTIRRQPRSRRLHLRVRHQDDRHGSSGRLGKTRSLDTDGTPFWGFRVKGRGSPVGSIDFEYGTPPRSDLRHIDDAGQRRDMASGSCDQARRYCQALHRRHPRSHRHHPDNAIRRNDAPMLAGVSTCDGIDGTRPFTGELDELMIFRSALSQPQIQALRSGRPHSVRQTSRRKEKP